MQLNLTTIYNSTVKAMQSPAMNDKTTLNVAFLLRTLY